MSVFYKSYLLLLVALVACDETENNVLADTSWKKVGSREYVRFSTNEINSYAFENNFSEAQPGCFFHFEGTYTVSNDTLIVEYNVGNGVMLELLFSATDSTLTTIQDDDTTYLVAYSFDEDSLNTCNNIIDH